MKRAVSCGVADATEPRVQEQVQRLFPPRTEEMPDRVVKGEAISSFKYLREALTNLKDGVSPGAGGFRHEYLSLLGEKMSGEDSCKALQQCMSGGSCSPGTTQKH